MAALTNQVYVSVLLSTLQVAALTKPPLRLSLYAVGAFVMEFLLSYGADATDVPSKQQQLAGNNSSADVTQIPPSSSTTMDPDDMTLEEYRKASGGALPPEYSLAAAAIGALILILLMIIVAVLTVLRNKFCSKTASSSRHRADNMDMISIDQSKASTSSNGRPATIKCKKIPEKSEYHSVAVKEKPEISSGASKPVTKRDLEVPQCHSRKSSTTTGELVTPREHYVSTSSLPTFHV